jgi:hypothetical protein
MSIRRLSYLQWFGMLAGGSLWFAEYLAGIGASEAVCNPASARWGVPHDAVQLSLAIVAGVVVLAAEAAAIVVFRATRGADEQGPPPESRLYFFAVAAMAGNLVFLMIIVLTGIGTLVNPVCHQA